MMLDLMLSVILILVVAYFGFRMRGPRDGKLATKIRILEHDLNYWRKRAEG